MLHVTTSDESVAVRPLVSVWFVNVGQGDCTIAIDYGTGNALVIDCPSSHVNWVRETIESEGAALHTCVVTHWDADHYGGVARLAIALPVTNVHYNHDTLFVSSRSPLFAITGTLREFLNIENAPEVLQSAEAGMEGSFGNVSWKLLAPTHHELTRAFVSRRRNIASAVVDVSVPSARILVGGDAVGATWRRLLRETPLRADVLRWPHHGARLAGDVDGTIGAGVLAAVSPTYVLISAGSGNSYGHPASEVVESATQSSTVLCSEVTAGCLGFANSRSRRTSDALVALSGIDDAGCAKTIRMDCFPDHFTISPSTAEHNERVDSWTAPMCRRTGTWGTAGLGSAAETSSAHASAESPVEYA